MGKIFKNEEKLLEWTCTSFCEVLSKVILSFLDNIVVTLRFYRNFILLKGNEFLNSNKQKTNLLFFSSFFNCEIGKSSSESKSDEPTRLLFVVEAVDDVEG